MNLRRHDKDFSGCKLQCKNSIMEKTTCLSLVLAVCYGIQASTWIKEMETPGLYQGDIVLNPEQRKLVNQRKHAFGSITNKRWPNGIIPYYIDNSIPAGGAGRTAIQQAINQYHQDTCLYFRPYQHGDPNYIIFQNGIGCNSPVGMQGGANVINLEFNCRLKGTVMHEIGHSIGLEHEQSRPDRGYYITIHYGNIDGDWAYAFDVAPNINSLGTPYDLHSMMHYSSTAFAKPGTYTITTNDLSKQHIIGHGDNYPGFSQTDIQQIGLMYNHICNYNGRK